MRYDWRQILNSYQRLSIRERTLFGAAVGAMVVIALYSFVWEPLEDGRALLRRRIQVKQRELIEIQNMRTDYMELLRRFEASRAILKEADADFSLFPHIEATVAQVVGRDHIKSMNPKDKVISDAYREEAVELKLTAISLKQLVDMIFRIEKGAHPLRVTRLQVKKRHRDPHSFDVTATVSMLKTTEG